MIKFLQGKLLKKVDEFIIVDVNGIGLEIEVPKTLVPRLPAEGSPISLHTYLRFAEDGFSLFGFENSSERDIFELLINTSGLGPRMSMAIISSMPLEDFVQAILDKNVPALTT
ncbi:MAG: Holliday junction branch migration protein RuvA, partial [Candidatus Sumerlaeia bacterium]|nr:Holliday junction branch migration protein RuvA [Candidatus Sumerlaeia bacterium]